MPSDTPAPTFLYIGAPKAGSSWLFEALRAHADVFVPPAKDIHFFDKHYARGWSWYQRFFSARTQEAASGEISHDYYACPEAPARIHRHVPDVRLICCLREPGDFMQSAYRYARNHHRGYDIGFDGYRDLPVARGYVDYVANLRRFYARFPDNALHVTFFDELQDDPRRYFSDICRLLGVRDDLALPDPGAPVNAAKAARVPGLARIAYGAAGTLRRLGCANLVGAVKRNTAFDRLLYQPMAPDPLSDDDRRVLEDIRRRARTEYDALEDLIGRSLPDTWRAVADAG
jgi:hypothetical protein